MSKVVGFVYNPESGYGLVKHLNKKYLPFLEKSLNKIGLETKNLSAVSYDKAIENVKNAIKKKEIDYLVCFGGDGMAHLAVNATVNSGIPFGIVPIGSGNDTARSLKIPIDEVEVVIKGIVYGIEAKHFKKIDLGKVSPIKGNNTFDPSYFVGVLSAGIDAKIARTANENKWLSGSTKYFFSSLKDLSTLKPYGYKIKYDNHKFEGKGVMCGVANQPIFGGGIEIAPGAKLDDGKFNLLLAQAINRPDAINLFFKAYKGQHIGDPRIIYETCKEVTIEQGPDGADIPILMADGEVMGTAPAKVEIVPKAVSVIMHPNA